MLTLRVTDLDGVETAVDGTAGLSVMQNLRNHGVEGILALCGGSCSCATCHVYVDAAFAAPLPPVGEDEDALLDMSDHRRPTSRLSCQLPFSDALDGMRVTIAPEG